MLKFAHHFILPLARKHRWTSFCEIGASRGRTADEMLALPSASFTIIDPCFDLDLVAKYSGDARVEVRKGTSLDILPLLLSAFDCILIDGDHNWYTVYHELALIRAHDLLKRGGMIFLHDVGWPYARRDLYYRPDTIPADFRLPYERKGIVRGRSQLVESQGQNCEYNNATKEGGERNGVLTAVEDFIAEHPRDYHFCIVHLQWGLGILQYRQQKFSEDTAFAAVRMKAGLYSLSGFARRRSTT